MTNSQPRQQILLQYPERNTYRQSFVAPAKFSELPLMVNDDHHVPPKIPEDCQRTLEENGRGRRFECESGSLMWARCAQFLLKIPHRRGPLPNVK